MKRSQKCVKEAKEVDAGAKWAKESIAGAGGDNKHAAQEERTGVADESIERRVIRRRGRRSMERYTK